MILDDLDPTKIDGCCEEMNLRLKGGPGIGSRRRVVLERSAFGGRIVALLCAAGDRVELAFCPFCGEKASSKTTPRRSQASPRQDDASAAARLYSGEEVDFGTPI